MERLTERTKYGIVGNNDKVSNYPLYKVANSDPLDHNITEQAFDKLAEYEDLEEQGLLLRLPCKMGDGVWRIIISDNYIMPCNVEEFVYSNSLYIIVREELFNTRRGLNINEIGKTVFLTKAEAEQKLKEMESDEDNEG